MGLLFGFVERRCLRGQVDARTVCLAYVVCRLVMNREGLLQFVVTAAGKSRGVDGVLCNRGLP